MDLQEFQGKLLGLIKSTYEPVAQDGAYLRELRTSRELGLVKEISIWWRCYQVENYCPLTAAWLKYQDVFETTVEQYYQSTNVPAYIEQAGMAFLGYVLSVLADPLAHSVAAFERALIHVKRGDRCEHIVFWDGDPYAVLSLLLHKIPYEQAAARGRYQVTVSHTIPGMFSVVKMV